MSDEDRQEAEGAPCDQAPKLTLPIRQLSLSTLHPDHLELWVTDQAGHLWHSWYWTSTGWQPWHEMEVPGSVGAFAAGETTELRQDLFVATDEDVQHRHCILEGSDSTEGTPPPPERNATWSPWQPFKKFPGGRIEQLGLATTGKHHLEAWAIDQAGGLWNSWLVDPDDWSEWSKFKTPGRVLSTAAGCRVDGHQDLFIATDDGISTCRHESRWGPWWDFQPQLDGRRVTRLGVSRLTAGHLELWALDGGGSLWHCWSRHQDEWQPWKQFDTPSPVVTFVAGQRADHRQELVVATDTGLYLSSYLADGEATRWEPWEGLPTASSEPG
ncbi:MAG TPA: hypothetical protein VHB02_04920 [Acidimicrobiales bacterium]|nr:hypothetical protein [Acidimicrobiales bacterium]